MASLGDPPTYSTPRTLGLALVSLLAALAHFVLGALDYGAVSRYLGLGTMLLAGLLLVFGSLTLIRYAEARDAMGDPYARAPMYATPHETLTVVVGVGLNVAGVLVAAAWAVHGDWPAWHLLAALVNVWAAVLAWRSRPSPDVG
ncbi:hypothetical protein HNQ07_001450 [Deinococcus metalli]|uniref:Uncharacterized protein n=1 Tax=Deinococcus metalli TaxID=1141878 RepID=A0A7W8NQL8_9DEIO|nr:hypothetical protein [Deinococcus metalli]MBB5375993.1 hypothetical protein [Deinococcus metalli]GHF41617.1 hypothetical protein GCM10017781_17910 [Deinococcus metalli]